MSQRHREDTIIPIAVQARNRRLRFRPAIFSRKISEIGIESPRSRILRVMEHTEGTRLMVHGRAGSALRQVASVLDDGTLTGLPDGEVLERFVVGHDQTAFEALIARHGPMVLSVCRQFLHDPDDAADAFQSVFLVLVRKARLIRVDGSLGPWLHAVAHRVAARARANRRRTHSRETSAAVEFAPARPDESLDRLELAAIIQSEMVRLPERLRAASGDVLPGRADARPGGRPAGLSSGNGPQSTGAGTGPASRATHPARTDLVGRRTRRRPRIAYAGGRRSASITNKFDQAGEAIGC